MFSLGLIFLEAGILKDVRNLYNTKKKTFDFKKFGSYIREFNFRYGNSSLLVDVVGSMLGLTRERRMDFLQIKKRMPSWIEVLNFYEKNLDLLELRYAEIKKSNNDSQNYHHRHTEEAAIEKVFEQFKAPMTVNLQENISHTQVQPTKEEKFDFSFDPFDFSFGNVNKGTYKNIETKQNEESKTSIVQADKSFFDSGNFEHLQNRENQPHKIYSQEKISRIKNENTRFEFLNRFQYSKTSNPYYNKYYVVEGNELLSLEKDFMEKEKITDKERELLHFYDESNSTLNLTSQQQTWSPTNTDSTNDNSDSGKYLN